MADTLKLIRPPGPKNGFLSGLNLRKHGPQALLRLARDYGDILYFRIGRRHFYVLNHRDYVQRVLHDNHANYAKSSGAKKVRDFLGEGLLTAEGSVWRRHRRFIQPAFHTSQLGKFVSIVTESALAQIDGWNDHVAGNNILDIHREMMKLTLSVVGRALFSSDLTPYMDTLHRAFRIAFDHTVRRLQRPFNMPLCVPTSNNLKFRRAVRELDSIIYSFIRQRRMNPHGHDDILDILLNSRDEQTGEPLRDLEVRDEALTLLLGGYDTSANALSWAFYSLSKNPGIARQLHEETVKQLQGRLPTLADLDAIPLARMVFEESMRLFPPVWILARENVEDDEIGGYKIPAGSMILLSPYVIQHDLRYWESPEGFDPYRFSDNNRLSIPKFAFFPFGGGPRLCMGMRFAMVEGPLILLMIVARYQLSVAPWHPAHFDPSITLSPKDGMPMFLSRNAPTQVAEFRQA